MNSGDSSDFDDKRLSFIYNELVKSYKLKQDTWISMLKTTEFNVCIYEKYIIRIVYT